MLLVRTEYKKGVLFVRLVGRIDNDGYLDKLNWLINEMGIKFTVLNVTDLSDVSLKNINHMINSTRELKKKKHLLFICDETNLRNSLFKESVPRLKNEIEAFSLISRKDAYE